MGRLINGACLVGGAAVFLGVYSGMLEKKERPKEDDSPPEMAQGGASTQISQNQGNQNGSGNQTNTGNGTVEAGSGETPWMDSAGNYIGLTESGTNRGAEIDGWNQASGGSLGDPWCASFVNANLRANGITGTGSASSQSFLNWGTDAGGPVTGSIVVFSNGDGTGHVGFVQSVNANGTINVLGGNQNNGVNVSTFSTTRVVGYRLPPGYTGGGTTNGNGSSAIDPTTR